ncbi:MAG TPA: archaellin/type IV pilin N-terminal domain-containing protein [archaeon]|nr:archaellin/type IV pilin N-terminal domain-containing protein [archaeon]
MKGISEIIATVLILMIVVGLAGTVFVYLQSSLLGRVSKNIDLIDVSCDAGGGRIYTTIKNFDPKLVLVVDPVSASEVSFRYNGAPVTPTTWIPLANITAAGSGAAQINCASPCPQGTTVTIKVIGPTNSVERSVIC